MCDKDAEEWMWAALIAFHAEAIGGDIEDLADLDSPDLRSFIERSARVASVLMRPNAFEAWGYRSERRG